MKTKIIATISILAVATLLADEKPIYQNPLDKPARNVRDDNLAPAKKSGYQNPLEHPAHNRDRNNEEIQFKQKTNTSPPAATAIDKAKDFAARQNSLSRQQTLKAEVSYLRNRSEALSRQYATKVPSMTRDQKDQYSKEQRDILNLRMAKEQELGQLQRLEAESQRNR